MKTLKRKKEEISLRDPDQVMRLSRLGSFHQTRLSFMRQLLRRIADEKWIFSIPVWNISSDGYGTAVYSVKGLEREYSLVTFANYLPADERSDRVIAKAWDVTFTLYDGVPDSIEINRLRKNVPLQEEGRLSAKELVLGRANKSVRLWNKVVDALSKGEQPGMKDVEEVGYLMRTTAVYGSGKFGLSDRAFLKNRPELAMPFQAEMLSVYLVRCFVLDLVEFVASRRGGINACKIQPELRKRFGIGNSTGLGMAPFLINHPSLFDRWIRARETAIARIRALKQMSSKEAALFADLLESRYQNAASWSSEHPIQISKLQSLRRDLNETLGYFSSLSLDAHYPWNQLYNWSLKSLSLEGQEALCSLILEPYPELVDDLALDMTVDENRYFRINGAISCETISSIIQQSFSWALTFDYKNQDGQARFWYVSEEKLEPRLGQRFEEDGSELEQPLGVGRDIKALYEALQNWPADNKIADFLMREPQHRHTVRRITEHQNVPYGEIRDNLIGSNMKPIDMLRCKLSFFGADRFDPRSDRWVRICMYQNAPFPNELISSYNDFWPFSGLKSF
tara:strand:+ start:219 stop:1916 length:1698 start_codon:yes stop_codon:yes gene_type:complete